MVKKSACHSLHRTTGVLLSLKHRLPKDIQVSYSIGVSDWVYVSLVTNVLQLTQFAVDSPFTPGRNKKLNVKDVCHTVDD
jgi:hypothetical protein